MSPASNGNLNRGAGRPNKQVSFRPKGKNYLMVVGIDEYMHCPQLFNAVKDARDVAAVLTSRYQFSADNLIELYNAQATQSEIIRRLRQLAQTITDNDTLLIYYSGHGEYDSILDTGYWIPVDGKLGEIGTFIGFDTITKFIKAIPSHHTFIIADSCYSGTIFADRKASDALDHMESLPSRWVLTAGRNEVVSDGRPGDNSPFADAVLFRLKKNEQERLAVSTFCGYIIQDVRNNANQLPRGASLHGVGDRGGEFMFRLKEVANQAFDEEVPDLHESEPTTTRQTSPTTVVVPPEPARPSIPETFTSLSEIKRTLQGLVAEFEFASVFEVFNKVVNPSSRMVNDLILLQGRYNGLLRSERQGILSHENGTIEKNRISAALLDYIGRLSAEDVLVNS